MFLISEELGVQLQDLIEANPQISGEAGQFKYRCFEALSIGG